MQTLEEYLEDQKAWSTRVFGEGKRTEGILKHIEKESDEVRDNPEDLMEWIDIAILALDGAWRAGYQPEEIVLALVEKQEINFDRKWNVPDSENKPVEHVRDGS
jgi:hypothetical protein